MQGVIAAVPTPVDMQGMPQKDQFLEHCRWVLENGCDGLNILGSTGEATSFDTETRKTIMSWAANNIETSKLMVGTGGPSLSQTIELTRYADDQGYNIALVLPPFYYKPISEQGLFDWYAQINEALGTAKLKIYFYNFPQMTGLEIPVSVIEKLHKTWPERFCGIKDSSGNLDYCRQLTSLMQNLAVFPSSEVTLGEAAKSGFAGCISATTNHTASLCAQIWANKEQPNADLLDRISELRTSIAATSLIPAVKYLVAKRTGDTVWEQVIPPFCQLSDDGRDALKSVLQQLGYD